MNKLSRRSLSMIATASVVVGMLALAGTAFAQTPAPTSSWSGSGSGQFQRPAVVGMVASVSGDTLSVTAKDFQRGQTSSANTTSTTYTVDAGNATVTKNGAGSSVSGIAVGDMVMVQGTVSGDTVTATSIRDGMMSHGGTPGSGGPGSHASTTPIIQGNGEPVIGGSVTAVNGTTLTVTAKGGTTYTVDASSATVEKGNAASAISNVAVGDDVVVQGTVNGTSVTATSVIDQGAPSSSTSGSGTSGSASHGGIMGAIGGFFSHLFGFF